MPHHHVWQPGQAQTAAAGGAGRRARPKMRCAGTSSGSGTMIVLERRGRSSKEVPVSIVGGLDVHRRQITFDWVDRATGQAQRGQITPATREVLGRWLAQLPALDGAFAVEACTAGGSWSRSCRPPGGRRIWLSRPRPRPCVAPSGGPRPTGPTPSCWGSCWNKVACPGLDPTGAPAGAAGAGAAAQDAGG